MGGVEAAGTVEMGEKAAAGEVKVPSSLTTFPGRFAAQMREWNGQLSFCSTWE